MYMRVWLCASVYIQSTTKEEVTHTHTHTHTHTQSTTEEEEDEDDFAAGQHLVACLIHSFTSLDPQVQYQMCEVAHYKNKKSPVKGKKT